MVCIVFPRLVRQLARTLARDRAAVVPLSYLLMGRSLDIPTLRALRAEHPSLFRELAE